MKSFLAMIFVFYTLALSPAAYAQSGSDCPTFTSAPANSCSRDWLFTNTTNNISNYYFQWDFGDGTTMGSSADQVIHTYSSNGSRTVKLTIFNSSCTQTFSQLVSVSTPTMPLTIDANFTAGVNSGNCSVTLQPSYSTSNIFQAFNTNSENLPCPLTYNWDHGDGTTSTEGYHSHTYANAGTYDVTLTVSFYCYCLDGTCGSCTAPDDVVVKSVVIVGAPAPDFSTTVNGCEKDIKFNPTSNVPGGCNPTYFWDFGDGNTSTAASPTHNYSSFGNYNARLTVNNDCDCGAGTKLKSVSVNNLGPTISFSASPSECDGTVSFTRSLSNPSGCTISGYTWDFGDGQTGTGTNPSHTYASSGSYNVTVTANNSCDCNGSVSSNQSITVTTAITPSITFASQPGQCDRQVQYTPTVTNPGGCTITGYAWDFDNNGSVDSTVEAPLYTFAEQGNYTTKLDVTYSCGCVAADLTSDSQPVLIEDPLTVDFSSENYSCTTHFTPQLTTPTSQSCFPYHFLWDFGDGNTSTDIRPIHQYTVDDNYTVSLTVTASCIPCGPQTVVKTKSVNFTGGPAQLVPVTIDVTTRDIDDVLSVTASTFSNQWPLDHLDPNLNVLNVDPVPGPVSSSHIFDNGSSGVWRLQKSAVFNTGRGARSQTPTINIKNDGTFSMESFNWQYPDFLPEFTDWEFINEVTNYSPYSFEVENKDALGLHSAALYGYGGQLSTAVGKNMNSREMAFTSFEEFDEQNQSGNWVFGGNTPDEFNFFGIIGGGKNVILANKPLDFFSEAQVIMAGWVSANAFGLNFNIRGPLKILCIESYTQNVEHTVITVDELLSEEVFNGFGYFMVDGIGSGTYMTDQLVSHSGTTSFKASGNAQVYPQPLIKLEPLKEYQISAWVSQNNPNAPTPILGGSPGIKIQFNDGTQILGEQTFSPSGPLVEGWQQVIGTFLAPADEAMLEILFLENTTATYYDDLRLFPTEGNMQSFVYDTSTHRLSSVLDENNYATYYDYDTEGNLYLVRKETTEGIKSIQESVSYQDN